MMETTPILSYAEAAKRLGVKRHYISMLVEQGVLVQVPAPPGMKEQGKPGPAIQWAVTAASVEARIRQTRRKALERLSQLEGA